MNIRKYDLIRDSHSVSNGHLYSKSCIGWEMIEAMNLQNCGNVWNSRRIYVDCICNKNHIRSHDVGTYRIYGRSYIDELIGMSRELRVGTSNLQMGVVP